MIKLKCPKCNHTWTYKGKLQQASCNGCGNKVKVSKNKVENG